LFLSGLAVVLGVAFVCGTFVFTDTLNRTFTDLFTQTTADVEITPAPAFDSNQAPDTRGLTIPAQVLSDVEAVPGVASAGGFVLVDGVRVIGKDGESLAPSGPPAFGASWSDNQAISPYRLVPGQGRGPERSGEIALDAQIVEKGGFEVGDTVQLVTPGPTITAELVGVFRFGSSGNLAGASLTAFDTATAQDLLLDGADAYTGISVEASEGTDNNALADDIRAVVPNDVVVQTGEEAADDAAADIRQGLSFVNIFLLVFAAIALVVGSFIILNTFSMLVAQRSRELALLRALGASRRQVTIAVLGEAALVGIVGSLLGIALAIPLAQGLKGVLAAAGVELPGGSLVIEPRTIIVGLVVGIGVTLVAAYVPARRASRVPPVAAMRDEVSVPTKSLRVRTVIGSVLLLVGLLSIASGTREEGGSASLVGLGVAATFVAVVALAPVIAGFAVRVLGAPFRRGITGRLAVDNARRNRRRTASTASALMIGLALVGTIATLGASTTASTDAAVDRSLKADFLVVDQSFVGFTPEVGNAIESVDGIAAVNRVRVSQVSLSTGTTDLFAIDPSTADQTLTIPFVEGSIDDLTDTGVIVDTETAARDNVSIGDTVEITFPTGASTFTVQGTYEVNGLFLGYVTTLGAFEAAGLPPRDVFVYATLGDGVDPATVRPELDAALAPFPTVQLQDQSEFKADIRSQINQVLGFVYALLALSLVISVLGIVNTLALSVVERTREIGLLRAVGMARKQLRSSIRIESVVISLFGAILGVILGVLFGTALQRSLRTQGIDVLSIPWGVLITCVVVAGIVGVLAALWPARRAARMDVLKAISTE
jgi:putative ABC transport system permease protein